MPFWIVSNDTRCCEGAEEHAQRGRVALRENGVIIAQFGALLTRKEEDFLLRMNPYHRDFKEAAG